MPDVEEGEITTPRVRKDDDADYNEWTKKDLKKELDARELEVEGTADDYAAALRTNDHYLNNHRARYAQ